MSETVKGLYAGVVVNLLVLALAGNTFWKPSDPAWLVTFGAANELLGVLLVASPELLPRMFTVLSYAERHIRGTIKRLARFLSRVLHLPRTITIDAATAEMRMTGSGEGRVISSPPQNVSTEELVAWLVGRYKDLDDRVYEVEKEVRLLPQRWRDEIAATRQELEGTARQLVKSLAEARIRLRLLGLGYVVLGIVLSWLGNVV